MTSQRIMENIRDWSNLDTVDGVTIGTIERDKRSKDLGNFVLINGLGSTVELGKPLASSLSRRGYRASVIDALDADEIVRYDRRNAMMMGWLAIFKDFTPIQIEQYSSVITRHINGRIIEDSTSTYDVAGHSWGGLALESMNERDNRIRNSIYMNTVAGYSYSQPSQDVLSAMHQGRDVETLRLTAKKMYGGTKFRTASDEELLKRVSRSADQETITRQLRVWPSTLAMRGRLERQRPKYNALIMSDTDDPITSVFAGQTLHHFLPNSELVITRDLGHMGLVVDPDLVSDIIVDYAKRQAENLKSRHAGA